MKGVKMLRLKDAIVTANPLKRAAAFLLDIFLLILVVISTFGTYFEKISPKNTGDFASTYGYLTSHADAFAATYYAFITIGALMLLYFVYLEYKYSQTIGMMLLNIYVESTSSKQLSLWQCILRSLYLIPVFPLLLLWLADPLFLLYKGERLSEQFSKTRTIEVVRYGQR